MHHSWCSHQLYKGEKVGKEWTSKDTFNYWAQKIWSPWLTLTNFVCGGIPKETKCFNMPFTNMLFIKHSSTLCMVTCTQPHPPPIIPLLYSSTCFSFTEAGLLSLPQNSFLLKPRESQLFFNLHLHSAV